MQEAGPYTRIVDELHQLIRFRADEEERIRSELAAHVAEAEDQLQTTTGDLVGRLSTDTEESDRAYADLQEEILEEYEAHYQETEAEYHEAQVEITRTFTHAVNEADREFEDSKWMVNSVYDRSADDSPLHRYDLLRARTKKEKEFLDAQAEELERLAGEATTLMQIRRDEVPPETITVARAATSDELHDRHVTATETVGELFDRLGKLWLPRQFRGLRALVPFVVLFLITTPAVLAVRLNPLSLLQDFASVDTEWLGMACAVSAGISLLVWLILYAIARSQAMAVYRQLRNETWMAAATRQEWSRLSKKELQSLKAQADKWAADQKAKRRRALAKANATRRQKVQGAEATRDTDMAAINDRYPAELKRTVARRDRRLQEAHEKYPAQRTALENRIKAQCELLTRNHAEHKATLEATYTEQWEQMARTWRDGFASFLRSYEELSSEIHDRFPSWDQLAERWTPEYNVPPAVPIGHFDIDLARTPDGISNDERLAVSPTQFEHPAVLTFPDDLSLTLRTDGPGRNQAVDLLQTTMLRLLTSLPPGKVRFTIIDPVGLGENFSAFMHLADYDEVLVTSRIWTEEAQISKRLLDLTEHMENVFQTYLRNEFGTIQEYNEQAGEVAEPYHFLVVANFPVGFNDEAARRLTSIASSGPRCGVHTLISVDLRQEMPRGFDAADLEQYATALHYDDGRFVWQQPVARNLTFQLESPPAPHEFSRIVRNVGDQSRDARHVEVPFERIAPNPDSLWELDSRGGINVPLGRAGATKLQHLHLGRGTSQHVMIAGKTGSGKSTLLHILITNLSLYYSPDEVEFFLIDFKKGVEFKTYATHRLPHARVVAIESDREFGLSVLERLDAILHERGDAFRDAGVQDVAGYRDSIPDTPMPRILLIIDEFQEFFVDDDQIAQRASLLLDRLVRQGRAFGIHVLLGSQTLGGAYTLARSTLGQVAVRIALQCSEADSHLILSEENMAARLLSRPGEAIYNDANGMMEGNHPFQIAWLDEARREKWLHQLVHEKSAGEARPLVVFEGNIPARPENNHVLLRTVHAGTPQSSPEAVRLWLGEPVAIKDSTSIPLRRQSGHNLLVVGQNETLARGTLLMGALSAAAQITPEPAGVGSPAARFYILTAGERAAEDAIWKDLARVLPHTVKCVDLRETTAAVEEIRDEITRRDASSLVNEPPIYVLVQGLSRFRDLRKDDDDFGFGGMDTDKPVSASKRFSEILREGPSLGIHTLIWCDTYANATRWLSTQSLREFELRIGFQMNATDSANLIDSPAASRLGVNRALLYVEESGAAEKFRPYGTPAVDWIESLGQQMPAPIAPEPVPESMGQEPTGQQPNSVEPAAVDERDSGTGRARVDESDIGTNLEIPSPVVDARQTTDHDDVLTVGEPGGAAPVDGDAPLATEADIDDIAPATEPHEAKAEPVDTQRPAADTPSDPDDTEASADDLDAWTIV